MLLSDFYCSALTVCGDAAKALSTVFHMNDKDSPELFHSI